MVRRRSWLFSTDPACKYCERLETYHQTVRVSGRMSARFVTKMRQAILLRMFEKKTACCRLKLRKDSVKHRDWKKYRGV